MRYSNYDDYRYSQEAREHDLMIIWRCDNCGREKRDYPGVNEVGKCPYCTEGFFVESGESYC